MSVNRGDDGPMGDEDSIPRQRWLALIPKRSLSRVLILLAGLAGIIYLRGRTDAIAGCMSDAFRAPATSAQGAVKVRLAQPVRALDASAR